MDVSIYTRCKTEHSRCASFLLYLTMPVFFCLYRVVICPTCLMSANQGFISYSGSSQIVHSWCSSMMALFRYSFYTLDFAVDLLHSSLYHLLWKYFGDLMYISNLTGKLLPWSHQDHLVQPEWGVPADVHQRGACVHYTTSQHSTLLWMLLGPAEPHGVRTQHAAPEVQLKHHETAGWSCSWLGLFLDCFHGSTLTRTSVLLAMSQVPKLHDCGNGFEVQALILSTGTAEFGLGKMTELGWNQKKITCNGLVF